MSRRPHSTTAFVSIELAGTFFTIALLTAISVLMVPHALRWAKAHPTADFVINCICGAGIAAAAFAHVIECRRAKNAPRRIYEFQREDPDTFKKAWHASKLLRARYHASEPMTDREYRTILRSIDTR